MSKAAQICLLQETLLLARPMQIAGFRKESQRKSIVTAVLAAAFALPAFGASEPSASTGSSAAGNEPQAHETWYYPDGTMAYRQGDAIVVVRPDGEVVSPPADSNPAAPARANGDELGMNEAPGING